RVTLCLMFFFSSRRRHTRFSRDWSSDVCSSDLLLQGFDPNVRVRGGFKRADKSQKSQQQLVEEICRDWLRMKVVWGNNQTGQGRSEERRVGKECRSRGWRCE